MVIDHSATAPMYVSHGGIGFQSDAEGTLPISCACRHQTLRLVALFERRTLREIAAPAAGWTDASLASALNTERAVVLSFAPVDAFLGDDWIGSTEV